MKKKKSRLQAWKKTARKVHLCLGLLTGTIVFILALTGVCLSFQDEIRDFSADYKTVEAQEQAFITASKAQEIAQAIFPNKAIHGAIFGKPTEAIEVVFYEAEPEFYQKVYLNPYTGAVLHVEDYLKGFLAFALCGHHHLWLPQPIGTVLVSYGTFLFIIILISGIILWWPKNKRHLKQSLKIKWTKRTSLKKKIIQIHTVLGVYVSVFAAIIAVTGCIIGLNWFYFIVFKAVGGSNAPQFIIPNNTSISIENKAQRMARLDELIPRLQQEIPNQQRLEIHYPTDDTSSILVEVGYSKGITYNVDYRFYDQNTLEPLDPESIYSIYEKSDFADKVIRSAYDTHVGAILGLFGKTVVFLASLIITILPLTGFLIWKKRKKEISNRIPS